MSGNITRLTIAKTILSATLTASLLMSGCSVSKPQTAEFSQPNALHVQVDSCDGTALRRSSAFALNSGEIVTVAHSFDRGQNYSVFSTTGVKVAAQLVFLDHSLDLAILRPDAGPTNLALESEAPKASQPVHVLSAPDIGGHETKSAEITEVRAVTIHGQQPKQSAFLDIQLEAGDSGAAVVNDQGQVVAMVYATDKAEQRSWALSMDEILPRLEEATSPVELTCP